jgi:putative iron-regulated protein
MKKILVAAASILLFAACKKNEPVTTTVDFNTLKKEVVTDFVNKVALPGYNELQAKAGTLNTAIIALNTTTTTENLTAARNAWKDLRSTWERCEGYLFGPVSIDEHDPETDTWPVNYVDMDALLASSDPLTVSSIEALTSRALKGYHPIEYILWGEGGTRTASSLTARQKKYVVSLSAALKIQADQLYNSWIASGGNYAGKVLTTGAGSTAFPLYKDFYMVLLDEGLLAICGEVGEGKLKEPFDARDPQIVESPFSGNSAIDFKNNITGAYNVYLGKFNDDGKGLNELIAAKNLALDNEIQQKFQAAIASFDNITVPYEQAIISQRIQCQGVMDKINDLATTLDVKLRAFIITNITD